jgi:DNA polymerase-3 subunit gamma/tau
MEMALVRFCYVSDLPGPETLLKRLQKGEALIDGGPGGGGSAPSGGGGATAHALALQTQITPNPQSFADVLRLIESKRDIGLRVDVERFVRLVSFQVGAITFEPAPHAPIDLARKLSMRLKEWTGQRWLIATEQSGGAETVIERERRETDAMRERIKGHDFVQSVLHTFPGAEIVAIRPRLTPAASHTTSTMMTQNADEAIEEDDD